METMAKSYCYLGYFNFCSGIYQWRAVTSETGHATGMPKSGRATRYFIGSQ